MCLPVFLAGCKRLFIVCGPSYLDRMWCVLELFVFIQMGGKVEDVELAFIPPDDDDPDTRALTLLEFFESRFEEFDVANAQCFDPLQKDRLLSIVEAGFGGLDGFNDALKETMKALKSKAVLQLAHESPQARARTVSADVPAAPMEVIPIDD